MERHLRALCEAENICKAVNCSVVGGFRAFPLQSLVLQLSLIRDPLTQFSNVSGFVFRCRQNFCCLLVGKLLRTIVPWQSQLERI